jgi:tetratricopeptide (TPR) repeat protein
MMRGASTTSAALIVLALLPAAPNTARGGVLGLLPPSHAPRLEGEDLSRSQILDRIDDLEREAASTAGEQQAALRVRIAQLYISTGLLKHRPAALADLDRAIELDPRLALALHVHAIMLERMGRPHEAQDVYETIVARFPQDPESYYGLGHFHFEQARVTVDRERFLEALDAFEDCVRLDPAEVDGWRGVAASAFSAGELGRSLAAAQRLIELGAVREGHFFAGATHAAMQHAQPAEESFDQALEASDARVKAAFEKARGVLDRRTAGDLTKVDLSAPERFSWQLTYWRRMVEADVLFGEPGVPGWETSTGDAWIRWGRPLDVAFEAPDFTGIEAADRREFLDRIEEGFMPETDRKRAMRDPQVLAMDDLAQKLHWVCRIGNKLVRLTFSDVTFHYRWVPTSDTGLQMQELRKETPFVGEVQPPAPDFTLDVGAAGFYASDGSPELETYVAIRPLGGLEPESDPSEPVAVVEWTIYDDDDRRLDSVQRPIDRTRDEGALLQALGERASSTRNHPFLMALSAQLPPGRYPVDIKVTSARNGAWRSLRLGVELRPLTPNLLAMSDLQLTSSYTPYAPSMQVPLEFVKYGYGILPNPTRTVPVDATSLFVYFEMYNVAVADDGKTQFDVTYEVFDNRKTRGALDSAAAGSARGPAEPANPSGRVEPLTTSFVQERTGVAAQGLVVKGSEVDISTLSPGRYRLAVTFVDRVAMRKITKSIEFTKLGVGE